MAKKIVTSAVKNAHLLFSNLAYYTAIGTGSAMLYAQYRAEGIAFGTFAFLIHQLAEFGEDLSSHGDTFQGFRKLWLEARRFYEFIEPQPEQGTLEFPEDTTIRIRSANFQRGTCSMTLPDLDLAPGSFMVIHGATGSGKTTLLEHLAFAAKPQAGSVSVGGSAIHEIRFSAWRQRIAHCAAQPALLEGRTIREILHDGDELGQYFDERRGHPLIANLLADLNRAEGLDTRIGQGLPGCRALSTGQERQLALVCGLVPRPAILFIDEVTAHQSTELIAKLVVTLAEQARLGTIIFFATHSFKFDAQATHILKISDGVATLQLPAKSTQAPHS